MHYNAFAVKKIFQLLFNYKTSICDVEQANSKIKLKSNLHYTRGITPKRVTSGGPISAAQRHSNIKTPQRWRAVDNSV